MVLNAAAVFPPQVAPGTGYDGVVSLGGCTGTLLSTGRHILTAAHCVDIGDGANPEQGNGAVNAGPFGVGFEFPSTHPDVGLAVSAADVSLYQPAGTDRWDGIHWHGSDIAIMELPELAPLAAERREIYTGAQEVGRNFQFLGYGRTNYTDMNGNAMNGGQGADDCNSATADPAGASNVLNLPRCGQKRMGFNQLDSIRRFDGSGGTAFDEKLFFDLDDPNGATPGIISEAMSAKGDSGGPLLIDGLIAGVSSGASGFGFGEESNYTRVSPFANWINQVTSSEYDLVIDMRHQRSVGGDDGLADTILLNAVGNSVTIFVNGAVAYQEGDVSRLRSITIRGSNDNETMQINSNGNLLAQGISITFDGRGGADSLTIEDAPLAAADAPHTVRLHQDRIERWSGQPLGSYYNNVHFSGLEGLTYSGAASTVKYDILGSPWLNGGQTTIYGSPTLNDTFTALPRDSFGNPTILGRIGIFGGASLDDTLSIDDSLAGSSGAIWNVENPHGEATQSFSVAGGDTIGAYVDVDHVILKGSQRDDVFRIESYQNGSSLEVQGLDGADFLSMSTTRHNLSADIKKMSYFSFDGGGNEDRFELYNDSNPNAWTYSRNSTQLVAREVGTGYGGMVLNHTSIGTLRVLAGAQSDQFVVEETPVQSGAVTEFDGGGGADNYSVRPAPGVQNLQNIRGGVRLIGGGGDALLIDDRNDAVGRTYHVSATQVGKEGGDNLFAPFGFVEFLGTFQFLQIATGPGVDIAHVDPHRTTPLEIVAGDPTAVPGDALFLNVAGVENPRLSEINSSTGVYSFDNRASVTYVGMEQRQSVVIKPDRDFDGVPDLVEDGAAGGDGNNDGIPDSQQADVASLPSLTGAYVTLMSQPGLLLADVQVTANPAPASAPAGVQFPLGFFDFRVLDLNLGEATTVTLILPEGMAATSYWKYGKTPDNTTDHWYEFTNDGSTGASFGPGGRVVTLNFVDGQRGDDALRLDGRIVDPGAPGISQICQVPGDTNADCAVDLVDLNNVRNYFGQSGAPALGDTNGDGKVDLTDLNNVRNYFGTTSNGPAALGAFAAARVPAGPTLPPGAVDAILSEIISPIETLPEMFARPRTRRQQRFSL